MLRGAAVLFLSVFALQTPQQAYMVWDKACITKIEANEHLRLEAPMRDGEPDMKQAKLYGVVAIYAPGCGRIEIRKGQQ
jgi:hypothetical protein